MAESYPIKRGDHYHLKWAVPRRLVSIIGKSLWRLILETTDREEADHALLQHLGVTGRAIQEAKNELSR